MYEVEINGLGSAGDGVGRLPNGRVIFVPRSLPGDQVRVRLATVHKRLQYGELVKVLAPSPDRVESRCQSRHCGSCPIKGLSVDAQARWKQQRLADNMARIAKLDIAEQLGPIKTSGDGWRYRHRVRLHAAWSGRHWRLGFFGRRSNSLVPFSQCPVMWPELEQAVLDVQGGLQSLPHHARLEEVEVCYSRRDGRAGVRLLGTGNITIYKRWLPALSLCRPVGFDIESGGARWRFGNLVLRYDHGRSESFDLRYEPGTFTQAHVTGNDSLIEWVVRATRPRDGPRVLELHAGVGNFTVPLGRAGARLVAVERNRRAAVLCGRNARAAGLDIEVEARADLESLRGSRDFDVVLLDPPRAGAKSVAERLARNGPPRVLYVSCDSATLARDAGILVQRGGYRITQARTFDMFPQTAHMEIGLVFERSDTSLP